MSFCDPFLPDFIKCNSLLPVIVQCVKSKEVFMLAYMNEEAYAKTIETGEAHFWSRSRNKLWHKGESSGHVQKVHSIRLDCDSDTLLLIVEQVGEAACHTGHKSCFYRELVNGKSTPCSTRIFDPSEVYK